MNSQNGSNGVLGRLLRAFGSARQAFREFLALPVVIIVAFLLLALATYWLDRTTGNPLGGLRAFLSQRVFSSAEGTAGLLDAIASSVISVTSITVTLLLLVVQQSASALSAQVFDQFLRRRQNQFYFGYFVGLSLFALITLATVDPPFNPVMGGAVAFVGTVVGLTLLLVLFYTTVNQTRPVAIIEAIHDRTLTARQHQLHLVRRTRRASRFDGTARHPVHLEQDGFVTNINLDLLDKAMQAARGNSEVRLHVSIGSYVAYQDRVAEVASTHPEDGARLAQAVAGAIQVERQRNLDTDPAFGIEQLENIAWTTISTSKQNPAPGTLAILHLRDLLARWVVEDTVDEKSEPMAVVYHDNTVRQLFDALEALGVVASESMQHQNFGHVATTLATLLPRMSAEYRARAESVVRRILPALGDLVLTSDLEESLRGLSAALREAGRPTTGAAVDAAVDQMRQTVGELNSRGTRVAPDAKSGTGG